MASSLGKMPTTSVRRLISPISRSMGLLECSLARCCGGPGGGEGLSDGRLDVLVGVGDDELDASETAPCQLAQKGRPEGLGLGGPDVHAQHLAPAVGIDADRDNDGDRHDAAGLADLHIGRVDP